jgi:hypothetical protein
MEAAKVEVNNLINGSLSEPKRERALPFPIKASNDKFKCTAAHGE